jgi:tRNA dimethylallyltransferase
VQRALEVYLASGRPISDWQRDTRPAHGLVFERWALLPTDRAGLHARIAERFTAMMAEGLLDEVRALRARPGLLASAPSLRAVGYRQLWGYLDGPPSAAGLERALGSAVAATRQLAKRQLTWINADPGWRRVDPFDAQAVREELTAMQTVCRRFG